MDHSYLVCQGPRKICNCGCLVVFFHNPNNFFLQLLKITLPLKIVVAKAPKYNIRKGLLDDYAIPFLLRGYSITT